MSRDLRPIVFCLMTVLAAFPALTLACEWACAPTSAWQQHHDSHGRAAHTASSPEPDDTSARLSEPVCKHHGDLLAATTGTVPAGVKLFAPMTTVIATHDVAVRAVPSIVPESGFHSPPAGRSAPIPLRI